MVDVLVQPPNLKIRGISLLKANKKSVAENTGRAYNKTADTTLTLSVLTSVSLINDPVHLQEVVSTADVTTSLSLATAAITKFITRYFWVLANLF